MNINTPWQAVLRCPPCAPTAVRKEEQRWENWTKTHIGLSSIWTPIPYHGVKFHIFSINWVSLHFEIAPYHQLTCHQSFWSIPIYPSWKNNVHLRCKVLSISIFIGIYIYIKIMYIIYIYISYIKHHHHHQHHHHHHSIQFNVSFSIPISENKRVAVV